jgi:hypothetical protein
MDMEGHRSCYLPDGIAVENLGKFLQRDFAIRLSVRLHVKLIKYRLPLLDLNTRNYRSHKTKKGAKIYSQEITRLNRAVTSNADFTNIMQYLFLALLSGDHYTLQYIFYSIHKCTIQYCTFKKRTIQYCTFKNVLYSTVLSIIATILRQLDKRL